MFILAGKKNNETDFRLYRWSGERAAETEELTRITGLQPGSRVGHGPRDDANSER